MIVYQTTHSFKQPSLVFVFWKLSLSSLQRYTVEWVANVTGGQNNDQFM